MFGIHTSGTGTVFFFSNSLIVAISLLFKKLYTTDIYQIEVMYVHERTIINENISQTIFHEELLFFHVRYFCKKNCGSIYIFVSSFSGLSEKNIHASKSSFKNIFCTFLK